MAVNPVKPLDAGTGRVCASWDPGSGAWLSFGAPHDVHGFVELAAAPAFDEAGRGDPEATRAHRVALADPSHAVVEVLVGGRRPALRPVRDQVVAPRWEGDGIEVATRLAEGAPWIEQTWHFADPIRIEIRVGGRLDRPALAEITETDPPPPTDAMTRLAIDGEGVLLEAARLPATVSVRVDPAPRWARAGNGVAGSAEAACDGGGCRLTIRVILGGEPPLPGAAVGLPARMTGDPIVDRALAYVRGCTTLLTEHGHRAVLTDHRLLPLSWTRDAYWQALALLAADAPGDRERVADHLRWLWTRCDRPQQFWARSHHANGRRKDLGFQADQQLYPILELVDLWLATGELPRGVDWSRAVGDAWAALDGRVDPATGLLPSGENAADDPMALPFIGASQILRWWTASRLAHLASAEALSMDAGALRASADATRESFQRLFADGGEPWPYAIDAAGARLAYHDANDLPIALAPTWGFCPPSDPGWQATMAFAFSRDNQGWADGPRAGLGSAHTPGPWTLGDLQAWIRARLNGEADDAATTLRRLREVAYDDGMLPEAYGADGEPHVRPWFAWPGAAYAALRMLDDRGALVPEPGSAPRWLG